MWEEKYILPAPKFQNLSVSVLVRSGEALRRVVEVT